MTRAHIFSDISAERERQDAKWGPATSPFVGNPHAPLQKVHGPTARFEAKSAALIECHRLGLPSEREAKEAVEEHFAKGEGTFAHLIVEELSEAVSAAVIHGEASAETRKELVQAAALIFAVIERIDAARSDLPAPAALAT